MLNNPYVFQVNGNCSDDNNINNTDVGFLYSCNLIKKILLFVFVEVIRIYLEYMIIRI